MISYLFKAEHQLIPLLTSRCENLQLAKGNCLDFLGSLALGATESVCNAFRLLDAPFLNFLCNCISAPSASEDVLLGATLTLGNLFNCLDENFNDGTKNLRTRGAAIVCRSSAMATIIEMITMPRFK